jgi:hypothetical protein
MQRHATKLQPVEAEQLSLIPDRKIVSRPVDLDQIRILRGTNKAIEYACLLAGVVPKEICSQMEVDKSTWSRICSGEWDLDGRDVPKFNQIVGNSAYLLYLCHLDRWDLDSMRRLAQNDLELENAELKKKIADQGRAIELLVGYHQRRR